MTGESSAQAFNRIHLSASPARRGGNKAPQKRGMKKRKVALIGFSLDKHACPLPIPCKCE